MRSHASGAPRTLVLKTGHPDRKDKNWYAGRQEVAFYTRVAPATPLRLVMRCFDAHWDAATNGWHLLLEDLAETHKAVTVWPVPPTVAECETIIDTWARFHAAWWDDPRLGDSIGTWASRADLDAAMQEFGGTYARFAEVLGDRLSQTRRDIYARFIDATHQLARLETRRNLTIGHGDAHVWNCFMPRNGGSDVRLFDWDSWRIRVPTFDLAYMMAMHWYPDRRPLERALLDRYHATLVAHGVRGYERRDLDDDYRWAILQLLMRPVGQEAIGIPPLIWWNNLERLFLSLEDFDCGELLTRP